MSGTGGMASGRAQPITRRLAMARLATAVPAASIAVFAEAAPTQRSAVEDTVRITVKSELIDAFHFGTPDRVRFGMADFIGGIELTSPHPDFGGFSALRVDADGERFVALSDRAHWLTGRILRDRERPSGIADAQLAPLIGPDGRTLASRGWYDTESLAEQDGAFYVGIERVNRIVRFDFARLGVLARAEPIAVPSGIFRLPSNKGLEALAFAPRSSRLGGALLAFSERGLDGAGNLKAFIIGGPTPGGFSVRRRDGFDISDCAALPSGDLILLERRFSWLRGIAMRLRRIALADITPRALVDGPVLLSADMTDQIDNMEGLSIRPGNDGGTVLTMISDDNFSALQRTILLEFKLIENA